MNELKRPGISETAALLLKTAGAVVLVASGAMLGGCLQSQRHDFLALRADAPLPQQGSRLSLADALPANIGPSVPPTALVEALDR